VAANIPLKYSGVTARALQDLIERKWSDPPADAERRTAATMVMLIRTAQDNNRMKGRLLLAAMAAQALAVVLVAGAVLQLLG
jgi:hypothetical protein